MDFSRTYSYRDSYGLNNITVCLTVNSCTKHSNTRLGIHSHDGKYIGHHMDSQYTRSIVFKVCDAGINMSCPVMTKYALYMHVRIRFGEE